MIESPRHIRGLTVVEYGFFAEPTLPTGYIPPDGRPPLEPVQNLAICTAEGVEGYSLVCCTTGWRQVTGDFAYTIEAVKRIVEVEFGRDVINWHKRS